MKTVIIACRTVEKELNAAMQRTQTGHGVIWLDSGAHASPEKLHLLLKKTLAETEAQRVLLAMGFCGGALKGLRSGDFELIVPRADDCISLLLGSVEKRLAVSRAEAAYFLTDGWLNGEWNLWTEYRYTLENYGEETARTVAEMLYGHYRTLGVLDTGVRSPEPLLERTKVIADTLHLTQKVIPGTLAWLERLLTGPWEEGSFLLLPPHGEITAEDMRLPGESGESVPPAQLHRMT